MKLYSYYRSTAAYRVRIALQYKGLDCEIIPVDLTKSAQHETNYRAENPQGRVPTLVDGNFKVGQSLAILEYLEERYPTPHLLPKEIDARAWVRCFAQIIACDMHPLNNLGSLNYLRKQLGCSDEQVQEWYHHWLKQGFDALEVLLASNPNRGKYCYGNSPTFADLCLVPQVFNAHRFAFSIANYPLINQINEYCLQQSFFDKATPEKQIDAVNK